MPIVECFNRQFSVADAILSEKLDQVAGHENSHESRLWSEGLDRACSKG